MFLSQQPAGFAPGTSRVIGSRADVGNPKFALFSDYSHDPPSMKIEFSI
jgi:hypothetical protein